MTRRFLFILLCSVSLQNIPIEYSYSTQELKKELIKKLYLLKAIKTENITLKSGLVSPIYFDIRVIISDPDAFKLLIGLMESEIKTCNFDCLCGVPYAAIPLATAVAFQGNYPMIMLRKESKNYGTKKLIEGAFTPGDSCTLIEDVITSGASILESVKLLENEGLQISDIFVVIDREQGGVARVQQDGYRIHVLYTCSEIVQILADEKYITHEQAAEIRQFCAAHQE